MGLKRHTHDFVLSSFVDLKLLLGRLFERERPYTYNERAGAIDNKKVSNSFLLFLKSSY